MARKKIIKQAIDDFGVLAQEGYARLADEYDDLGGWLADRYPNLAAPKLQENPKKQWWGKNQSPEEKALMKERTRVIKEVIEPGDYSPMFPLEDRYYVDPKEYPLAETTMDAARPAQQKTYDRKVEKYDTPEARQSLRDAFNAAKDKPLAQDWYAVGQLQDAFKSELGEDAGRLAFKEDFADAMAATTGGADPSSNLIMAHYGNYLRNKGLAPPTEAYQYPSPVGGQYITGNMKMYDDVINNGRQMSAGGTPKRHNFSGNFLGHRDISTIDKQMTQGMTAGKENAPPDGAYPVFENMVAEEAAAAGVQPANMQDVAWAGYKGSDGKPMMQEINERIEITARLTGLSPEEVLKRYIRKEIPLYGGAGAAVGYLSEEGPGYPARPEDL